MGILCIDKGAREILEIEYNLRRENDTCSIVVTVRWFSIDIQCIQGGWWEQFERRGKCNAY